MRYVSEITTYSKKILGDRRNYHWGVEFDNTGPINSKELGFIGITQFDEHGKVKERVLLSPKQVQALIKFVGEARRSKL